MKKDKSLAVVHRLRGFYEKLGVDYEMMRLILETKVTMDKSCLLYTSRCV